MRISKIIKLINTAVHVLILLVILIYIVEGPFHFFNTDEGHARFTTAIHGAAEQEQMRAQPSFSISIELVQLVRFTFLLLCHAGAQR